MPKLIAVLAAVLVGAVVALVLCQVLNGREGMDPMGANTHSTPIAITAKPFELKLLSPVADRDNR